MKSLAIRSMAVAFVLICAAAASAQSLADVARQEEARRQAVGTPGKVYTNDALRPEPAATGTTPAARPAQPAEAPDPAGGAPTAEAQEPTDPAAEPAETPTAEAEWRARVTAERDALSRAQIFADALQSRINVLAADFVNRDDPAQRNVVEVERQKALAELDRVKLEIEEHQKAITAVQEEARQAGVPAGWVR